MANSDVKYTILSIISIAVALVAIVSDEYRILILGAFAFASTFYFLYAVYDKIDKHTERLKKLEEKIDIYKELGDIKAEANILKKEVFKK